MNTDTTSVPTSYALSLLQAARDNGCDTENLLEELGLSLEGLTESRFFSAIKYGQLYQRLIWLMQDECFGMFSGGKVRNGSFRLMCLTVIHCTNLRQALIRAAEFCEICRGFEVKNRIVEEPGGLTTVAMCGISSISEERWQEMLANVSPNQVRTSLAVWHRFNCWLIGREIELEALYFTFPCPDEFKQMAEIYPMELKFEQEFCGFSFSTEYLDYPVVQNQETLMDFIRSAPYHLVINDVNQSSLKAKVRAILSKDVSVSMPSAEVVASHLNLSVTTLRRRLQGEESSYQRIKDECRMEAAFHYLGCPDLSNTCIAERLGFDESSAFFRAFKKWTGITPGEYRKRL